MILELIADALPMVLLLGVMLAVGGRRRPMARFVKRKETRSENRNHIT
jgi:hypothetical protein